MPVESQPAVRTSRVGLSIACSSDTAANRVLNHETSCENYMTCTRIGPVNFYIAQSAYAWKWTLHSTHINIAEMQNTASLRYENTNMADLSRRRIGTP